MDIFERWFEQDLTKKVGIQHAESLAFSGNNESNIVGVYVYKDGAPAELTGTVTGTVIRPDGMTVPLTGTLNGNAVSITLTEACFAVPGYIGVALTVTSGDITMTVLKARFEVEPIETGTVVDPSGEITANVAELISDIETAVATIPPSYSDLLAAIAPTFDPEAATPYPAGAYVWYSGALYRFIADHTGAWTGTDAENVSVGEEHSDLKSAVKQSDNELFRVSGYLNQNYVKGRQRYVDAGVEKFGNQSRWISPAQGEYIELKSGDMIVTHQSRYHFRVCYSTDNKATWIMSSEQTTRFSMPSDAVGWISIVTTTTATDEDVETILNKHIIEIIRNGVNLVGSANANVNGIMDALNISPNNGFQIEAIKDGTTFVYVNATATENNGTEKLFEIQCAKDDIFRIKFDFQAMAMPENFVDYYLMVREINENESSPLRNVCYKLSELQTAADFTVYCANTKKIIANVNLKRSDTTVSSGYYEEIKYTITVIKVLEQNDDVYTEAGEAWEV